MNENLLYIESKINLLETKTNLSATEEQLNRLEDKLSDLKSMFELLRARLDLIEARMKHESLGLPEIFHFPKFSLRLISASLAFSILTSLYVLRKIF